MTKIKIVKATREHAFLIGSNLRQADIDELKQFDDTNPLKAVIDSFEGSQICKVVLIDDVPSIILGVGEAEFQGCDYGIPWMLATDRIEKIKRAFVKGSAKELQAFEALHPKLFNYVHCENALAIRWLEWLGFNVDKSRMHGNFGNLYFFSKGF